jgi:phage head maturation protease
MKVEEPIKYPLPILVAQDNVIEGYIILYDKKDQDGDVFKPGCVNQLENEKYLNLPILVDGDWENVIGSLKTLLSDHIGVYAVIELKKDIDIEKHGLSFWFTRELTDQGVKVNIKGIALNKYES